MSKIHINVIQNVYIHACIHTNIHILYVGIKCHSKTNPHYGKLIDVNKECRKERKRKQNFGVKVGYIMSSSPAWTVLLVRVTCKT